MGEILRNRGALIQKDDLLWSSLMCRPRWSLYILSWECKLVEKCITVFICALLLYQTLPYRHIEWKKGDKKANNLTSFPISTNYLCLFAVALHYPKVAVLPSIKTSAHAISNGFLYLYCHELVFPTCMHAIQSVPFFAMVAFLVRDRHLYDTSFSPAAKKVNSFFS